MSAYSTSDSTWKGLYKAGGIAALLAGIVFRRNIGAEVSLFSQAQQPVSVVDWFSLLQENKLLGLAYLNVFDILDYALVGLMFLALFAVLRQVNQSASAIGTVCALLGVGVYFASNTAFSMLALSHQYAAATSDVQRSALLAAGQALLAFNHHGATGMYVSLCLVAIAGLLASLLMLRSQVFSRSAAIIGILASALDLAYCAAFPFLPANAVVSLALATIPAAGLFLMIWHILVGWRLLQLGRQQGEAAVNLIEES